MVAALVVTWERSAIAAAMVGLFCLARRSLPTRSRAALAAIFVALFCAVCLVRAHGPVNYKASMQSVRSRARLLDEGMLTFSRHWLNGVGVGYLSLPVRVPMLGGTQEVRMLEPYNQYLYWLDEMGIFGAVLIGLFGVSIRGILRDSGSSYAGGLAAVWVSVLVAGCFNTLFGWDDFSCGNMLIGSLLGITMRLGAHDTVTPPASAQGKHPR
jgi:drug/metabolite transporter (DMT)-like permease